jgi:hypothetical protein
MQQVNMYIIPTSNTTKHILLLGRVILVLVYPVIPLYKRKEELQFTQNIGSGTQSRFDALFHHIYKHAHQSS